MPDLDPPDSNVEYFHVKFDDARDKSMQLRAECVAVLEAIRAWREADRALQEASRRYMKLGESDMRAIRFVVRAGSGGKPVTPKDIAVAVGISSAATTKLLDRLESHGHVRRVPHPTDRRTLCVAVTDATRKDASASIGVQHARRLEVVAALSSEERHTIEQFFRAMTNADQPSGLLSAEHVPDSGGRVGD